jgi:hypothetical protein
MKNSNKKLKAIEWGLILTILAGLVLYKYLVWGCVIICGDWYDD